MALRAPQKLPLFGREALSARIEAALSEGERLVSVVGIGGVGKTALVSSIASDAARLSELGLAGVRWCTTVPGSLEELVLAVALASEQRLGSVEPPAEALARALVKGPPALLVLDECERSLAAVEALVPILLARVPALRILVTSRVRLAFSTEVVVEVAPLDVPAVDSTDPVAIAASPAVLLLLDRARRGAVPPALLESELGELSAIAQRVGGLPLALELCAARFNTLSPKQLLARLSQGTLLLSDKRRGSRHESLEAIIRASWELLAEAEQRALGQCSVFTESFSLEAAEAVLDPGGPDVEASLLALRAQSMVGMRLPGPRFTLLEAVREFAAARLAESGEAPRLFARHAAHFARLGVELAAGEGGDTALEAELPNLLAVVRRKTFAVEGRRSALAAASVLRQRGALVGLAEVLGAALDVPAEEDVGVLDAELLLTLGEVEMLRGRRTAAVLRCDSAVSRAVGAVRARALIARAAALSRLGRFDEARRDLDEAESVDASAEQARALARSRATLEWHTGTVESHRREALRALSAAQEGGDPAPICDSRLELAKNVLVAGEAALARAALERARGEAEAAGQSLICVLCDHYLAVCHLDAGRLEDARRCLLLGAESAARADLRDLETWSRFYLATALKLIDAGADVSPMLDQARQALKSAGPLASAALYLAAFAGSDVASFEIAEATADAAALAFAHEVRAHRAVTGARKRAALGDAPGAREALDEARTAVAEAQAAAPDVPPGYRFDVRLGARLLRSAIDATEAGIPSLTPVPKALVVGPEARWFRLEGEEAESLERAPAVRRLLEALVQARLAEPDQPLSVWDLWRAGWPDDKGSAGAASNRVYVTLNRLRRLGLEAHIVRHDEGWVIDARVRVERA